MRTAAELIGSAEEKKCSIKLWNLLPGAAVVVGLTATAPPLVQRCLISLAHHLELFLVSVFNSEFNSRQSGVKRGKKKTCFHQEKVCRSLFFFECIKISHSLNATAQQLKYYLSLHANDFSSTQASCSVLIFLFFRIYLSLKATFTLLLRSVITRDMNVAMLLVLPRQFVIQLSEI